MDPRASKPFQFREPTALRYSMSSFAAAGSFDPAGSTEAGRLTSTSATPVIRPLWAPMYVVESNTTVAVLNLRRFVMAAPNLFPCCCYLSPRGLNPSLHEITEPTQDQLVN